MLPTMLKPNSNVFREVAKTLYEWVSKDVNVCRCRSYHSGKRQTFLIARNILKKSRSPFSSTKLSYVAAVKSDSLEETNTSEGSSNDFYRKHNITVKGRNVPPPILSIDEDNFPPYITNVLEHHNVRTPTPIQSVAWSVVCGGRDLVGVSPTGSGKTLAFGIPAVMRVKQLLLENECSEVASPLALILAPTRELARQIEEVINWFQRVPIRCLAVYGGSGKDKQVNRLSRGVDIVVATPGRCFDLMDSNFLSMDRCSYLVLDEADRMLDMGFLPQIEPIIEQMPAKRQNLLWSATWPREVRNIALKFLNDYVHISVGSDSLKPNKNVKQTVVMCQNNRDKFTRLIEFLTEVSDLNDSKVLIFVERKIDVIVLVRDIMSKGFYADGIHSDKSQKSREISLDNFRDGRTKILVATSVAERGIDVDNITHVVNYDCPTTSEGYVHRIGRTGRMEKKGEAITYVSDRDTSAGYLVEMLKDAGEKIPEGLNSFKMTTMFSNRNRSSSEFYFRRSRFPGGNYRQQRRYREDTD